MNLGYDEVPDGGLVAAVRVFDPEGAFAVVDVEGSGSS